MLELSGLPAVGCVVAGQRWQKAEQIFQRRIRMHLNRYLGSALLWMALTASGFANPLQKPAETTSSVPELTAFHEVIYKIWHEAWPNKDTALLKKLLPDVEKGIAKVASAQLPGILRDKKTAWDQDVQALQTAGADYRTAAAGPDAQKLFNAAEKLHACFEKLMRTIRPPLKELDEFHSILYMLYHHYLLNHQTAQIKASAEELVKKMAVLDAVRLPERLQSKENDFRVVRGLLSGAVGALAQIVSSNDEKAVKDAVEAVHTNYQKLEKVLE
jgi:hypothetical protein